MTRSELILHFVWRQTRETPDSVEDYSEDVVRVAQQMRDCIRPSDFKLGGSSFERMGANGLKLRRWMKGDGSGRPSVDVEDLLVLALKEPYRSECEAELAARRGGIFIALRPGAATFGAAGELLASVAKTCEALAPVLKDNAIDDRDSEEALLRLRSALLLMQAQVGAIAREVSGALAKQRRRAMAAVQL